MASMQKNVPIIAVVVGSVILIGMNFYKTIPPGRIGVATLFGSVQPVGYSQGLHIPVNPLYRWTLFDAREKTHLETANVPTQDQLQTKLDVSVQYRIDGQMAPEILEQTGDEIAAVRVHLIPKLRSLLREQGKSIERPSGSNGRPFSTPMAASRPRSSGLKAEAGSSSMTWDTSR